MPGSGLVTSEDAGTFPVSSPIQKVSHGFTLIELLIVIVIIGIITTVTLYAFGDFGASRKAKATAEQFIVYTKLLEQQAILETKTFALKINSTGYDTYFLDNASKWSPMPQRGFFHQQSLPSTVLMYLDSPHQNHTARPDIIVNSAGELTPFTLYFGTQKKPQLIHLEGKHNGDISLQNIPTP